MIYAAKYNKWESHSKMPFVEITEAIGMTGDIKAETVALLKAAGVDYDFDGKFQEHHLKCLKPFVSDPYSGNAEASWTIPEGEIKRRLDLRSKRICTIDPTTARDLDDALSIDKLSNGHYRIGVHIADVTHFLAPGTALDVEAKNRATTIYLVQKSLPMLPRALSENLCSLAPKVDRLAFSCFFTMTPDGKLSEDPQQKPWFGKTVIRTCCQLDYQTAQKLVDCKPEDIKNTKEFYDSLEMPERMIPIPGVKLTDVARDLRAFDKIAKKRRAHRFDTGSLSLDRGKVGFRLDENQLPIGMFEYLRQDSNKMIEEFMLLANLLVAEKIVRVYPETALIRYQRPPDWEELQDMQAFMKGMGYNVKIESAKEIHDSLLNLESRKVCGVSVRSVAELLLTRPMLLAQYGPADRDIKLNRHYALNFQSYTHFTSPIRRYVDVIVHRMLAHAIAEEPNPSFTTVGVDSNSGLTFAPDDETIYDRTTVALIAENCNLRKKLSKQAQDDSGRVYMALCIKACPIVRQAIVIDMGYKSFKVMLPKMGIDAQVYVDDIKAFKALVVNAKGEKVDESNEANTPKNERFLSITWKEGKSPERIGIFGGLCVKLTAKMSPPPIDICYHVVKQGSEEEKATVEAESKSQQNAPAPLKRSESSSMIEMADELQQ